MTEEDPEIARARALVGHVLDGKWTLEHLLGAGAMGAVYAARHRNGARAAVKLLHPELARVTEVRERFLREGYAANRVGHRGAVQVLDDDVVKEGEDEGTAYLVMELLEGESLDERITRGERLDEREILLVLDEVLEVLEAAHANGVVHRDLKPANLFLAKDPDRPYRIKVLDFGLARLDERATTTRAGLAMGTPSFMSPEQASGRVDEIDGRTDLFALGATAFLLASGAHLHEAGGLLELVVRHGTTPARKLREVDPSVSQELAAIVDRAVAFLREDRYPTAAAMRADVRARLEALGALRGGTDPSAPLSARMPVSSAAATAATVQAERIPASSSTPVSSRMPEPVTAASILEDRPREDRRSGGRGWGWLLLVAIGIGAFAMRGRIRAELSELMADATAGERAANVGKVGAVTGAAASPGAEVALLGGASDASVTTSSSPASSAAVDEMLDAGALAEAHLPDGGEAADLDAGDEEEEEDEDEDAGAPGLAAPLAAAAGAVGGKPAAQAGVPHAAPHRAAPKPTKKRTPKKRRTRTWRH